MQVTRLRYKLGVTPGTHYLKSYSNRVMSQELPQSILDNK